MSKRETLVDFMARVGGGVPPAVDKGLSPVSEEKSRLRDAYGKFKARKASKRAHVPDVAG